MKLSVFTTMTDPESRNDPYKEALKCYEDLGDELIVVGKDCPIVNTELSSFLI